MCREASEKRGVGFEREHIRHAGDEIAHLDLRRGSARPQRGERALRSALASVRTIR